MNFLTLALAAALGATSGPPPRPPYREIKDWVLVCDNLRTCHARFAREQEGDADGHLDVARDAGPAGRRNVSILTDDPNVEIRSL